MSRLIVVINAFNEAKLIKKCIDSVIDVADEVRVYDGAYADYPHEKPYSTDGMLQIISEYPQSKVKLIVPKEAWKSQIDKRTAMFAGGKEGDYFLRLDGDEYILNPEVIREHMNADVGWVWTISNLYDKPYKTARLIKWREGLHFGGRHHWIYVDKEFITSDQHMNLKYKHIDTPIKMFNFRDSSNASRAVDKVTFLNRRNPLEWHFADENAVYNTDIELSQHPCRAGNVRETTKAVIREAENPSYSFTLMISRDWAIDSYFHTLKDLFIPVNTEAVVVVDTKTKKAREKIYNYFEKDSRFTGVKLIYTNQPKLPENSHVGMRRKRIVDNWYLLLTEVRADIILGSEDDSLPIARAYPRLLERMSKEKADFVQGNIIGRWGAKICPAWKVLKKDGIPYVLYNEAEKYEGVSEVQGVGWYCFVAKTDLFRKYLSIPEKKYFSLGPDVEFGYRLSEHGHKVLHDWEVAVTHFGQDWTLVPGYLKTEQIVHFKPKGSDIWETIVYNEEDYADMQRLKAEGIRIPTN